MALPHEDHIWELAEEHDIAVVWSRARKHRQRRDGSWGGSAYGASRQILLGWQSQGEDGYWVALHEMAHLVLDLVGLPETPEGAAGEADCWAWALRVARCAPTPHQVQRIERRLRNYEEDRGRHPRVQEVINDLWIAAETAANREEILN